VARLNGYINSPAYHKLEEKLLRYRVQWNVGVGPTACFTRAISSIARDVRIRKRGPFDHVIEVDMKQNIRKRGPLDHVIEVGMEHAASELGILSGSYPPPPKMSMTGATSQMSLASSNPLLGMIY